MHEFGRFFVVGIANSALGYAVIFGLMLGAGWSPEASNVSGYAVGLVVSYALNRSFTFRSRAKPLGEASRFLVVFGVAFALNLIVLTLCVRMFGVSDWISQIIAGGVYVVSSYLLNRSFVFGSTHQRDHSRSH